MTLKDTIVVEPAALNEGEAIIDIQNDDDEKHRLMLARTDLPADSLPVEGGRVPVGSAEDVEFQGEGYFVQTKLDPMRAYYIGPQKVTSLIHDYLEPGHYVLFCNRPGHYERGEHAEITVGDAS